MSAEFRERWPRQKIVGHLSGHKRIDDPTAGRIRELRRFAGRGAGLAVLTPVAEGETERKAAAP